MYTPFTTFLGATILSLLTLVLAQDNTTTWPSNGICVSGSLMLMKCCSPTTFTTCETTNATCRAVPFNGACSNNKLAIRFPADQTSFDHLHSLGVVPTDIIGFTDSGHPTGPIDEDEARHMKVRREARESLAWAEKRAAPSKPTSKPVGTKGAKGKIKNLALAGSAITAPDQPPQPCQIVGNVVFDRCDLENALLDHFMGDDPCDFGC